MSTLTTNDQNIIAGYANQLTGYLFGTSLNLTPDIWDKSGATIAVTETLGASLNNLFGGWTDVTSYKDRQYYWASKVVADAEVQIGMLSNGATAEAGAMRRAAQVAAENMRVMGDRAASGIPVEGASSAANLARAAEYAAAFAKYAGAALAIGQMTSKTYDAAIGETTTHDVMGTAVGAVAGILGGAAVGAWLTAAFGTALLPAIAVGAAAIGAGYLAGKIGQAAYDHWGQSVTDGLGDFGRWLAGAAHDHLPDSVNTLITAALNWVAPRRDPLVLDLDGNGITTSAINPAAPILFDQDGDGTKTATGWIASGEAIVVRDLNGNGTIDSGRELFGDNTILTRGPRVGQLATNGFEALADLDSNGDGKFNSLDADFASVKLWKDLNQDGISQSGELFTFAQLGVASINVAGTASNVNLGGGNTQTFSGSFTKTDGATGTSGIAHLAGSLLLANNNFYREFTDDPALTTAAQALPQMIGSGLVRDLRPAMSLGTAQALDLQAKLTQFAADTTHDQQMAHLDALVQSWGNTSSMATSLPSGFISTSGDQRLTAIWQFSQTNPTVYAQITALEQFNGQTILDKWVRPSGSAFVVAYSPEQGALIQQAYDALKTSVYGALVVQTLLKCGLSTKRVRQGPLRIKRGCSSRGICANSYRKNSVLKLGANT